MISEKIEREYNLFKFKDVSYSLSTQDREIEISEDLIDTCYMLTIHLSYLVRTYYIKVLFLAIGIM